MKGYARENTQQITAGYSALRKCRNAVSAGVLSPISSAVGRNGAVGDKESARAGARNYPHRRQIMRLRRCGGELAFPWRGGGLRRPHFFLRRKKCGKESRLDLRSKGPLARCRSCKIGGADFAELVRRGTLSVQGSLVPLAPLRLTAVRVGVGALVEWRLSNRAHCGALHRNG